MEYLVLCSDFLISRFVRYVSPTPISGVICQDTDSAGGGGDDDMGGAHVSGAHHRQRMTLSRPAGTAGRMHLSERAGVVWLAPAEAPWPALPRDQRA